MFLKKFITLKKIKEFIWPLLLALITVTICFLNYTPGTFLSGWDSLHPEFNFPQQFSNMFYGVFRTDQGLGAVAAHSHMADLTRVLFLWVESFILPLSFLRYSYIFLCFVMGPLGVYFFIRHLLSKGHMSHVNGQLSAFIGTLCYIFNLVTVQQFYVPFEMFTTQYAALGWLFLTAVLFLEKPTLKKIALFSLVTLLATPQAYAAVLWYAYFACFCLFLVTFFLFSRTKKIFKSGLLLILVTLIINSFWLLPNFYFLATTAKDVSLAQTNKIFSDEAFLHNKQYGNIVDSAILKNFLFNWTEQVNVATSQDLMRPWKQHLSFPGVIIIGYLIFLISLAGIVISIIKIRWSHVNGHMSNVIPVALIPIWGISILMIINMNPPFEFVFAFFRDHFSLFKEGLRFPFTKFSILLIFSMSIFVAIALNEFFDQVKKLKSMFLRSYVPMFLCSLVSLSLLYYGFPMFQGKLIDPKMRITIPQEYFGLYSYMQKQPESSRVAPLPVQSIWGWEYYDFGYQGAGFLWFGLPQPTLARDFDRWNFSNEQYYREISGALYSRDAQKVYDLAQKYRISYFLLDENIAFAGNKQNALWHYETKATFDNSKKIKLVKKFGNNLLLYRVDLGNQGASFLQSPKQFSNVGPTITGGFVDLAATQGDYIHSDTGQAFYPARNLVNRYDRINPDNVKIKNDTLTLKLSTLPDNYNFNTSWLDNDIFPSFMKKYNYDVSTETESLPYSTNNAVYISIPVATQSAKFQNIMHVSSECGNETEHTVSTATISKDKATFMAKDGASCGYAEFADIKQDFGSLLTVEAKNITGLPIRLCVTNQLTRRCAIYTTLDQDSAFKKYVFMIPPEPTGVSGYAVHFNTVSIGNEASANEVKSVNLIQIPYYRIQHLYFTSDGSITKTTLNEVQISNPKQVNSTLYSANVSAINNNPGLVELFKAYDGGWHAYLISNHESGIIKYATEVFPFLFGKELKEHVLVNNWANGWIISNSAIKQLSNSTIIVVFLPQYLEYAGFLLLGGMTIVLITLGLRRSLQKSRRSK